MYLPLSEYMENRLAELFCEEYRVYSTCEKTVEWEEYKSDFADFTIKKFAGMHKDMPPKDWR
jgi:hypothetical protein